MTKRANYGFVKRQKELKKQQKTAEKAEKKRLKKESANGEDQRHDGGEGDVDRSSAGAPLDPV